MKYITQLNTFWRLARLNELSVNEVIIYLSLLDIANATGWQESLSIPNSALYGNLERKTLERARQRLVKRGLITYKKGKRGQAPVYTITSLYRGDGGGYYVPCVSAIYGTYKDKERDKRQEKNTPVVPMGRDIDTERVLNLFNDTCVKLPSISSVTGQRKRNVIARFNEYGCDDEVFIRLFEKANESTFLCGANESGWKASFDWLIKQGNMAKVLEGNYDSVPTAFNTNKKAVGEVCSPSSFDNFDFEDIFERP